MATAQRAQGALPRDTAGKKGLVERVIETLANGLGNSVAWMADSGVLFALFAVLWLAVGAGIIWAQGSVDAAWHWIRGLPLLVQGIVWLLFLPVMAGVWIWESTWPVVVRVLLVVALAGWNLLIFLPRALQAPRP